MTIIAKRKQGSMASKQSKLVASVPTGIQGFDEATAGGLPKGRVAVVLGGAGSGKTIFGMQMLASGVRDFDEPGILVAFEENAQQVFNNTAGFGWKLNGPAQKQFGVVDAQLSQSIVQGGDFDILGLLAMLTAKIKAMRAKRLVLDGLDVLLANLEDPSHARREVFRLREWLQDSALTALITAKTEPNELRPTRQYEFLQFMADCVVTLEHRITGGTALRFMRVVKYRGAAHSANELPFVIGPGGIEVSALAESELHHAVSHERISTGIPRLDTMLTGGYYRGSSTLISGVPGTAKTTLAAAFANAACKRGERTLLVSFDEAPEQIVRNVRSVGLDLARHLASGVLRISSLRSRVASPEAHVARIRGLLREHKARHLVIDPISAFAQGGGATVAEEAAIQIIDLAKSSGITSVSTSLLGDKAAFAEETPIAVSTVADTWMHLTYVNQGGERNRALTIIKSRGTSHSNQVREIILSHDGITLADVYTANGEVLMGTLRWQKEDEERRTNELSARDAELREREAELALAETEARIQMVAGERAVRLAALERLRIARVVESSYATTQRAELKQRRGADDLAALRSRKSTRPRA